jgi:hypothetical protein
MIKSLILPIICCILAQTICVATAQNTANPYPDLTPEQVTAEMRIIMTNLHANLAWRAAVVQKMLVEANWAAARLELPTPHPILMTDIQDEYIGLPFSSMLPGTNRLYDINIPREERLHALKFGPQGWIATASFQFYFNAGKLWQVERLSAPNVERYALNLGELVGKPSLIDTNGAYQLATQWLAAVDVDMKALEKLKWTVNQLHYRARGATNYVTLPLYYVDFGNKHFPASENIKAFDKPLVSVEVLGTTKELQELEINEPAFSRRPRLFITNALELFRTPNPSVKQMQNPATAQAYALTPTQVSNYAKNFQSQPTVTNVTQPNPL